MKSLFTLCAIAFTTFAMAQPAGSLDPTFGVGGRVTTSILNGDDKAYGVAIQTDGKIVVSGTSTSNITGKDFVVVRYNSDGSLDETFGVAGKVTTDVQIGSDDIAYSLALQGDGKIILAGSSDNGSNKNAALMRYNTDGTIDISFGNNGKVLTDFENSQQDEIRVVKIHALTGNIIVGGSTIISSNISKPVVARYTSAGILDNTFDNDGIRTLWVTNLDYQYLFSVEDLAVQTNGKITAVGWRDFPGQSWSSDYWACRISSDGSMDNTFSGDGVNVFNGNFNGHDRAYSMILKSDNSIIMAGGGYVSTLKYDFTLSQLTANGLSGSVSATIDYGSLLDDIAYGLAEDSNGSFVLAGVSGNSTTKSFALSKVTSGGSLDNTFGTNGKVTTTFNNASLNECYDIAIQLDNKIVAVGYAGNAFAIARYVGVATPQLSDFQLITPANGAMNQNYSNLIFDWSDAFGATGYELEIDNTSDFSGSVVTYNSTTSTKTVNNLMPATIYYWRVRATDGAAFGTYSEVRSFNSNTLENFTLQLPLNNAINQEYVSLVLDWSNALGAAGYAVEISTASDFSVSPLSYTSTNSTYTAMNLAPVTTYYWHVRVVNGTNIGTWSDTWNFTTKENTIGVDELSASEFLLYPNPVRDVLVIESTNGQRNDQYKMFDNMGKVVLSGLLTGTKTTLSLKNFATGNYFVQIGNDSRDLHQIVVE